MTVLDILDKLTLASLAVTVRDGKLIVTGNLKRLTPELSHLLATRKAEIVEHLTRSQECRVCKDCWNHPEQLFVWLCDTCPERINAA